MRSFKKQNPPPEKENQAFMEGLYRQYNRLMFSTALQYFSNQAECEDIIQDALIKLCGKVEILRDIPSCAIPAYIVYTVKSVAINRQRHLTVIAKHTQDCPDEVLETAIISPQDHIDMLERKVDFEQIWICLSEDDQELLFRKYVFGESDQELAESLQCTQGNIRMRLTRIRKKILQLSKEGQL